MEYVTLGKTGLKVSRVGLGGIPIQRSDAANTVEVVDALEKHGMNYIDTARGYTVSEEYLGAALKGRREKFILATKSMVRDYEGMKKEVETSLKNLRTDHIEVYQLHNLPLGDFDKVFGPDGAYRALAEAKAAGKIGHIGATFHNLDALRKAGATFLDGEEAQPASRRPLTKADLYALGLSGAPEAARRRQELLRRLDLPERLSPNAMLEVLNALYGYEGLLALDILAP